MAERVGVELDEDGTVLNLLVLPENDADLGEAWESRRTKLRVLSDAEREQGVGIGHRRAANGRFVDDRQRPEPAPPRPDTPTPAPPREPGTTPTA